MPTFVRHALGGCDHKGVREWFCGRIGIDHLDYFPPKAASKTPKASVPPKVIEWPAELVEGTAATWAAFAEMRGFTQHAVWVMVMAGILRFCKIDGIKCYVVTDSECRAAEIRRIDGKLFGERKAYHLRGVDKSWLPGANLLREALPEASVLVVEGASDLLTAIDLYSRYRRDHGGTNSWQPVALLGAGCKHLAPECAELIRGRHVRLVPDADEAGDRMRLHWCEVFRHLGCPVDCVELPRNTDLTDNASNIQPSNLFSK